MVEKVRAIFIMFQALKAAFGLQSNAEKLYMEAYNSIGFDVSPEDVAPDELGCAESMSNLINTIVPFPKEVSTRELEKVFDNHYTFIEIKEPEPYAIILSVTGTGNGSIVGHVGQIGKNTAPDGSLWVMSNNSFPPLKGIWLVNFTVRLWFKRYVEKGGLRTKIYRMVG